MYCMWMCDCACLRLDLDGFFSSLSLFLVSCVGVASGLVAISKGLIALEYTGQILWSVVVGPVFVPFNITCFRSVFLSFSFSPCCPSHFVCEGPVVFSADTAVLLF